MTTIDMSRYTLVFSEEFDEASFFDGQNGTWKTEGYYANRTLPGNGERQYYVDPDYRDLGLDPFRVENGILTITAEPASADVRPLIQDLDYTSGMITSEQSFSMQYGYFEIRAQMPEGQGLWPAFWLMTMDGQWPPEYDVVEVLGHEPDRLYGTAHFNDENGVKQMDHAVSGRFFDSSDGFHTYGLEWNEDEVIWYYDGIEVGRTENRVFDQPMYMITNLAVGGYWPGNPDETTPWPAEMHVDHIRVFALNATHEIVGIPADWAPIDMASFSDLDGSGARQSWDWKSRMEPGETAISLEGEWARLVVGNDGDNFIRGSDAPYNEITGGRGNDVLDGRGGTNLYIFRPGDGFDTILGFTNDIGASDKIRLEGFHFRHFDDVIAWSEQIGDDVVIRLAEDQAIRLRDVRLEDLAHEQFVFTDPVEPPAGAQPIASAQPAAPIVEEATIVDETVEEAAEAEEAVETAVEETFEELAEEALEETAEELVTASAEVIAEETADEAADEAETIFAEAEEMLQTSAAVDDFDESLVEETLAMSDTLEDLFETTALDEGEIDLDILDAVMQVEDTQAPTLEAAAEAVEEAQDVFEDIAFQATDIETSWASGDPIIVETGRGGSGNGRGALKKLQAENAELKALLGGFEDGAFGDRGGPPAWANGNAFGHHKHAGEGASAFAFAQSNGATAKAFAASNGADGDAAFAMSFASAGVSVAFSFSFVDAPSASEIASFATETFAELMAG